MDDNRVGTADVPAAGGAPGQELARHDAAIAALEHRFAAASQPRRRFSFQALYRELALEAELSAAREARGALLYDHALAKGHA